MTLMVQPYPVCGVCVTTILHTGCPDAVVRFGRALSSRAESLEFEFQPGQINDLSNLNLLLLSLMLSFNRIGRELVGTVRG